MTRYASLFALILLAATPLPASADAIFDRCNAATKAVTDSDLAPCGSAWVAREEVRLKLAWKRALDEVDGARSEQGKALLDEQRAWIAFKDKACRRYDVMSAGTLGRFHDAYVCRAQIIGDRINELGGLRGDGLS
ncbi:lysozyme inhibitor LprI family protein [Glacieibacterium megasporae]|uniref:lysozyme inhibitor LprI family protein n=1 Tax=Glacieibacterium megasporae TaxID=2835787 RepID=UPI001C1E7CE5|nr:lysozyme inhibitor LprI family protein [Polymorphobacter megasporae]UAJ09135.1 DUF1311 domain-containing protein [Polymorphobacter megasporae]